MKNERQNVFDIFSQVRRIRKSVFGKARFLRHERIRRAKERIQRPNTFKIRQIHSNQIKRAYSAVRRIRSSKKIIFVRCFFEDIASFFAPVAVPSRGVLSVR